MHTLASRYPGYGWEHNVGYGTRHHVNGIRARGLTPFHRLAYRPVRAYLEQPLPFADLAEPAPALDGLAQPAPALGGLAEPAPALEPHPTFAWPVAT
jgi:hypothetical protein